MTITTLTDENAVVTAEGLHILTYAEEGFAPLNIHAQRHGLSKDQLLAFAEEVNQRGESGSLHPRAPISAVPRVLIRGKKDSTALIAAIKDFLRANRQTIHANRVLCDFRTPRVPAHVVSAIKEAMQSPSAAGIDEVTVLAPAP